ncbi:hypothetical protein H2198_010454 [Neophaeococcomyces mojaviensis]|uniref:Uncharacterized protein n=1 Tax=Neophaeococcomyces mojaviensis TaxID=3383035 RepID=A0ACC2ZRM4_9EURO|nr:hypothetical protein H2198_010454 [Knufia sp. JES_112]
MAQRALRKLRQQRELEEQRSLAASLAGTGDEESEEEFEQISKPKNVFDMLDGVNDEDEEEDEEGGDEEHDATSTTQASHPVPPPTSSTGKSAKTKKKKAKNKAKAKVETPKQEPSEDEIDRALKELDVNKPDVSADDRQSEWEANATQHLAIVPKNLDAVNEMRGLFGSIALEDESRARPQPTRRRDQNQQGGVDLATALTAPYNRASRGKALGALAKRRNCFMQGREDWPLATSGGLSMEAVPSTTFEKQYNVLHNPMYQQAQWHFRQAVESMQAENMIGLLSIYPYHIASLLQVSEIAKHQGDSLVAGDLLERALFSFGRSVHSSFPAAMRSGVARVPFNKPANRELYLTIWRYIRNLEQRGTWKTAFEWCKLLLQLNTLSDPYGVTLMIDQVALRGRQHEQFLELASDDAYASPWSYLANIQISKSLALLRAKKPKEARQQLALAMHHYPYILSALASAIEISPMPKSLWGKTPSTDAEKLYTELYVSRAKDLWNTPETIGLISEVANTLQYYKSTIDAHPQPSKLQISLEEARHIMLLETPSLIALLPRHFTNMPTSSSDVLPPPNSEQSDLTLRAPTDAPGTGMLQNLLNGAADRVALPGNLIQRALQMFMRPVNPQDTNGVADPDTTNALADLRRRLGPAAEGLDDDALQQIIATQLIDDDELAHAFTGGAMAGGWDYYEDAAEHGRSDGEDSIPDLEDVSGATRSATATQLDAEQPARGLHAATVEEADSDDEAQPTRAAPSSSRTILRHVDSDDEDEPMPAQGRSANLGPAGVQNPNFPTRGPFAANASDAIAAPADEDVESSQQRLQRWLITAGLEDIKGGGNMSLYVKRLKMLTKVQQTWTLNVVKQRGDKELAAKVEGAM